MLFEHFYVPGTSPRACPVLIRRLALVNVAYGKPASRSFLARIPVNHACHDLGLEFHRDPADFSKFKAGSIPR